MISNFSPYDAEAACAQGAMEKFLGALGQRIDSQPSDIPDSWKKTGPEQAIAKELRRQRITARHPYH